MKTLTTTIKKAKSKVMRTAWHLFRSTGVSFAECLRQAWRIIKQAFESVETEKKQWYFENYQNVYKIVQRANKEVNKEILSKIVFLAEHFIRSVELDNRKAETERRNAEIRASYDSVIAEHMINQTSLD